MASIKDRLILLTQPAWSVSDIQSYLDCSREYAVQIKNATEVKYGAIAIDKGKGKTKVSADSVIKMLGGTDRRTEAELLGRLLQYESY